jgi:uncharacterized membrane protein YebE (DUF533 family)
MALLNKLGVLACAGIAYKEYKDHKKEKEKRAERQSGQQYHGDAPPEYDLTKDQQYRNTQQEYGILRGFS